MADRHERIHEKGEADLTQMYWTLCDVAEKVDRMDKHIMGGSDPNAGLLVRVKSVERDISRAQKSLSRVVWTFLSAIVGGIGLWVWERVKGHNP